MAIYRNVQLSFWTDNKVEDDFTPEDKYFYLYLLTNPQTNICGCYEVSYSQMTNQTGYNKDTINRLLDRFEKVHGIIRYCRETKEILILNWHKYNWSNSSRVITGIESVAKHIKCKEFKDYIYMVLDAKKNGTDIEYEYSIQTSVSDTDSVSDSDSDTVTDTDICKNVIDYLNMVCDTNYRSSTPKTRKQIKARVSEGFLENDFYAVIDKKSKEWLGTDMEKYLRPETLFGTKFEGYLNQKSSPPNNKSGGYDWDNV